jgi:NADPH:quinone reductase
MKAIRVQVFDAPEVMHFQEVPDLHPGPEQVVVRVHAAGVNPVDAYMRSGDYAVKAPLPYTPGSDAAGVIDSVGAGVKTVKVGERVFTTGTITGSYAEQTLCHESQVHPLPQHLSFAQGAGVHVPYGAAYRGLFQRARAIPGDWVLVHGATGGVGIAAVQLARAAGMKVVGTGGTERGRDLIRAQGAHNALDHHLPDYLKQAVDLTGGRGFDVIVEMLANVNLGKDLPVLAQGGRVVIIGSRGPVEINPRDAMGREAAVLGMMLFNTPPKEAQSMYAALVAGLENKTLHPVIGREIPMEKAPEAHRAVLEPGAYGKIVLIP